MKPRTALVTLTAEERNLLYLTVTGHTPAQSASAMDLPLMRAQTILKGLQRRFGASSRKALVVQAIVQRWF